MDSNIPTKKARFENYKVPGISGSYCIDNVVQDETEDLWADNEFTAEEFDFLQSQVSSQAFNVDTSHNLDPSSIEVQKLKEHNYGLEGQIKMLRNTLEKNSKELDKERLEKMSLMEKYSEQQKQQQKSFEKEKERMETYMQFKEQELQAAFGKIAVLEQKDKCTVCTNKTCIVKNCCSGKAGDIADSICGALNGPKSVVQKANVMIQTENKETKLSHRLNLWCTNAGSVTDLVTSNILCRDGTLLHSIDAIIDEERTLQTSTECTGSSLLPFNLPDTKFHTNFTRIALSRLNIDKENNLTKDNILLDRLPSFQILHLLHQALKECLSIASNIINAGQQQTPSLSWSSTLCKDKDWFRLNALLNSGRFPLGPVAMEEIFNLVERQQVVIFQYLYHLLSMKTIRNILFSTKKDQRSETVQKCNEKSEINEKSLHPLITGVLTASTPLFYEGKCINKATVEWSLAVLVKSAEYSGESFDRYLADISVCSITSGKCSLTSSWLLLHLLQYLLPFEFLTNHIGRHTSLCIYNSLLELCERIGMKDLVDFEMKIMTLVLNLLSGLLSSHKLLLDCTMVCHCLQKLFDIIMKILNAEIRLQTRTQNDKRFYFLQNGMSSFNWLRQLNIFQDQFSNNQPIYISLWNDSSPHLKTQLGNESPKASDCIAINNDTEMK